MSSKTTRKICWDSDDKEQAFYALPLSSITQKANTMMYALNNKSTLCSHGGTA